MTLPPRFDALDPAVLADPYPRYAELRAAGPLARGGPGTWMVTRYADVHRLLTHPALTNHLDDAEGRTLTLFGHGPAGELSGRMMSALGGDEHTAVRDVVHAWVGPAAARDLAARVEAIAERAVADLVDAGGGDAVEQLALRIQAETMCAVLGLEPSDRGEIWPDAIELGRIFIPYRLPEAEQLARADTLTARLRAFVRARLVADPERPGLLSALGAAARDGRLSEDLAVDNLVFLFFSGFETTMNVLSSMCALLPQHPTEFARVGSDPGLVPTAVAELLRFDAPSQYTIRLSAAPLEVGDRTIRAGRMVLLLLGSANRDETAYAEPDRLDLGRHPNPHLSFGGGRHHCVGRALGQLIGETTLRVLATRCARLELTGNPIRLPHPNFRAYASVPLRLHPR